MTITLEQAQQLNGKQIEINGKSLVFKLWVKDAHQRLYINNGFKSFAVFNIVKGEWMREGTAMFSGSENDVLHNQVVPMIETILAPVAEEVVEAQEVITAPEAEITWAGCPVAVEVPEVAEVAAEENVIVREGYEKVVVLGEVEARLRNHFICKNWYFFLGEERLGKADRWELAEDASLTQLQAYAQSLLRYRANPPKPQPSTKTPAERLAWEIEMNNK